MKYTRKDFQFEMISILFKSVRVKGYAIALRIFDRGYASLAVAHFEKLLS